jgi:citrate lyase beta subunit
MRHHQHNSTYKFIKDPIDFNKNMDKNILQYCLGATLYMPGTKDILKKILDKEIHDYTSLVMCFEDAIKEDDLDQAEKNVSYHLEKIGDALDEGQITIDEIPLIFIRVRNLEHFFKFSKTITSKQTKALSGFVFPKFASENGYEYLRCLEDINRKFNITLYAMPLLEGRKIALKESRIEELIEIQNILKPFKAIILNLRVGGTDLSSIFGVRRGIDYSIYDILTVKDCLSDILNFFTRIEDEYVISGPVWEYFLTNNTENFNQLFKNNIHHSLMNRNVILNGAIDGLLREVIIDKANGFVGKTIIHPSHAKFINAIQAVTMEEYEDATQILETNGGVIKSNKANKMNEINPHRNWANKICLRAKAYGVIKNESDYIKLFLE